MMTGNRKDQIWAHNTRVRKHKAEGDKVWQVTSNMILFKMFFLDQFSRESTLHCCPWSCQGSRSPWAQVFVLLRWIISLLCTKTAISFFSLLEPENDSYFIIFKYLKSKVNRRTMKCYSSQWEAPDSRPASRSRCTGWPERFCAWSSTGCSAAVWWWPGIDRWRWPAGLSSRWCQTAHHRMHRFYILSTQRKYTFKTGHSFELHFL